MDHSRDDGGERRSHAGDVIGERGEPLGQRRIHVLAAERAAFEFLGNVFLGH
jgi:hypothetical protein